MYLLIGCLLAIAPVFFVFSDAANVDFICYKNRPRRPDSPVGAVSDLPSKS